LVGGEEPARENSFVENDEMVNDDAVGEEVKATILLVVKGVAKEEATSGARR
jgi:hypothetical protein